MFITVKKKMKVEPELLTILELFRKKLHTKTFFKTFYKTIILYDFLSVQLPYHVYCIIQPKYTLKLNSTRLYTKVCQKR